MEALKKCPKCQSEKPREAYSPASRKSDGLVTWCKDCCAVRARGYRAAKAALKPKRVPLTIEQIRAKEKAWRQANKEKAAASRRAWSLANPERERVHAREKYQRYKKNPVWRLVRVIRAGMWKAMKGVKGSGRWFDLLDYNPGELRLHLERQFQRGMSWDNFGEWHIDHILPLSSFTITGPDDPEFKRAWALTNLRPLWGAENMSKGAKRLTLL